MKSLVKNAADPTQIKEAGLKEKFGRERELEDVRFLLNTKEGRRFLWRLLSLTGLFQSSFTGNSTTFFKEGSRNIGLQVLADINDANPEGYLLMLKENREIN